MDSQGPGVSDGSGIKLGIKFSGRTIPVEIAANSTIKNLKIILQTLTNVLPRGQTLIFKGKVLSDELTLASSGISDGSKVMLMASHGLHQGEGFVKRETQVSPGVKGVADVTGRTKGKPVTKGQLERWKATGVIALAESHLSIIPEEVWACEKSIRVLDLSLNSLLEVPAAIGRLTSIQKLLLSGNHFSDESICWEGLSSLKSLVALSLNQNNLTSLPSSIGALTCLKQLNIASNKLTCIPTEIGFLKELQVLNAQSNRLKTIPTSIKGCVSLVEVDLSCNLLAELPEEFGNLRNLKALYLSNNGLSTLPNTLFKMCLQLSILDLHGTSVTLELLRQLLPMEINAPLADAQGPAIPQGAANAAPVPPHIPFAHPAVGAAQPHVAAPARRNRNPRGPIPVANHSAPSGAPALLEIVAAIPMYTEQRRTPNLFLPDAQMLFHVLSICDSMMNTTHRFLKSSPAWLPIISQIYISVLWNVMILRVYSNSGYGSHFSQIVEELVTHLQITECLIPGPLLPFFQSLAAINGPFEWIGDIVPFMPDFSDIWNSGGFHATDNVVRQLPIPAILLDQLYAFANYTAPNAQSNYALFEWYRNVFGQTNANVNIRNRMGPQMCGSLYTTNTQFDTAKCYWNSALANGFTRTLAVIPDPNAAAGAAPIAGPPLTHYAQLLGFLSQRGNSQLNWFQTISGIMAKYALYFNSSAPLKSVLPTGLGAAAIYGVPHSNVNTRNWLYPTTVMVESFTTSRFAPRREIPDDLGLNFRHADHELEEQAEQFAIITHTNIKWSAITAQNNLTAIDDAFIHRGDYWSMLNHRNSPRVSLKTQFAQMIAARYHQDNSNRV